MRVSDYNRGRSVSDLNIKDWSYGTPENLRSENAWTDDRYDPTVYSHPHRYDNVNFPEQEYKDVFGGTMGTAMGKELDRHQIGIFSGTSSAMNEYEAEQRRQALNPTPAP
jgi:hypothetical protein